MPTYRVFAYATLQFPEVLRHVLGRDLPGAAARLHGYRRARFVSGGFPGLLPDATATVDGTLYCSLRPADLARLDDFEGDLYVRRLVPVTAALETQLAFVYLVAARHRRLFTGEWDADDFVVHELGAFLERIRRGRYP